MTNPNIFDGQTHRPMTDDEFVRWQADNAEAQAQAEAEAAKALARQAVLTRLGLTSDEAKLLFG